jgi:hypothetical protein
MHTVNVSNLPHVMAEMAYTKPLEGEALVRVFPPSSGRKVESPARERIPVPVYDCRPIMDQLDLDEAGFQVLTHRSVFHDFYDPEQVKQTYYPE